MSNVHQEINKINKERLIKQFENFVKSYEEYELCLSDEHDFNDEMIHFLIYHRWFTKTELLKSFPNYRVSVIERTKSYCHPSIDGRQFLTKRTMRMKNKRSIE